KETDEVKASYKVYAVDSTAAPKASGDVKASNGGFGVGSALKIASSAGQMYMGMGLVRGLGFGGLGMGLDPVTAMATNGGVGALGGRYFDPRASAMSSMAASMSAGGLGGMTPNPSDAQMYQTVNEALDSVAKAAIAKVGAPK